MNEPCPVCTDDRCVVRHGLGPCPESETYSEELARVFELVDANPFPRFRLFRRWRSR